MDDPKNEKLRKYQEKTEEHADQEYDLDYEKSGPVNINSQELGEDYSRANAHASESLNSVSLKEQFPKDNEESLNSQTHSMGPGFLSHKVSPELNDPNSLMGLNAKGMMEEEENPIQNKEAAKENPEEKSEEKKGSGLNSNSLAGGTGKPNSGGSNMIEAVQNTEEVSEEEAEDETSEKETSAAADSPAEDKDNSEKQVQEKEKEMAKTMEMALQQLPKEVQDAFSSLNKTIEEAKDLEKPKTGAGLNTMATAEGGNPMGGTPQAKEVASSNPMKEGTEPADFMSKLHPVVGDAKSGVAENELEAALKEQDSKKQQEEKDYSDGRIVGLNAGRSMGLQKKVSQNMETKKLLIEEFPAGQNASSYVEEIRAVIEKEKSKKFQEGFDVAFNEGFHEGKRLKFEKDSKDKEASQNADPAYAAGKADGIKAAYLEVEGKNAEAEVLRTRSTADDNSTQSKGFFHGFNKAYMEAKAAKVKAKQNADNELMANPLYSEFYNKGSKLGFAIGKDGVAPADMDEKAIRQEVDAREEKEPIVSEAFFTGFNKAYMQGRIAKVNAQKQKEAENKKNINYKAGEIKGALAAASNDDLALAVLKGSEPINTLGEGVITTIPTEIQNYFKEGRENALDAGDKSLFELGYSTMFNRAYFEVKQKRLNAEKKKTTEHPDYKNGEVIGKVMGEAASIAERLQQKIDAIEVPDGAKVEDTAAFKDLNPKLSKMTENMNLIRGVVDKNNSSEFQSGYWSSFNASFIKDKVQRVQARQANTENQLGEPDENTELGKGILMGRKMGEQVYKDKKTIQGIEDENKRETLLEKYNQNIRAIFDKAESVNPEYNRGFVLGFNQTVLSGGVQKGESLTAAAQDLEKQRKLHEKSLDAEDLKEYYIEGYRLAYGLWYKASNGLGAKSADPKKTIAQRIKGMDAQIKEEQKEQKGKKTEAIKLVQEFNAGVDLGEKLGKQCGADFKRGFDDAMNGKNPIENQDKFYKMGFAQGQQESQYQGFRDALFDQSVGAEAANNPSTSQIFSQAKEAFQTNSPSSSDKMMAIFRDAFNLDFASWVKIYFLTAGMPVPEDFEGASLELGKKEEAAAESPKKASSGMGMAGGLQETTNPMMGASADTKKEEKPNPISDRKRAELHLKNVEGIILTYLQEKENSLLAEYRLEAAQLKDKEGNFLYKDDGAQTSFAQKMLQAIDYETAFRQGYNKAVEAAKKQFESLQKKELYYAIGYRQGYIESEAPLPSSFEQYAATDKLQLKEAGNSPAFQEGKIAGLQAGMENRLTQNTGDKDAMLLVELGQNGQSYQTAFAKGLEEGESLASEHISTIKDGGVAPPIKLGEYSENIEAIALEGYKAGFERGYWKKLDYQRGFFLGFEQATQEMNTQNIAIPKSIRYETEYRNGVVAGLESGRTSKASGQQTSAKLELRNEAFRQSDRLAQKLELEKDKSSKIAFEKGYFEGVELAENNPTTSKEELAASYQDKDPAKVASLSLEQLIVEMEEQLVKWTEVGLDDDCLDVQSELIEMLKADNKLVDTNLKAQKNISAIKIALKTSLTEKLVGEVAGNKPFFDKQLKGWGAFLDKFKEAFDRGAQNGISEGAKLSALKMEVLKEKKLQKDTDGIDTAAFFKQLLSGIGARTEVSYSLGYGQGLDKVLTAGRNHPNATEPELKGLEKEAIVDIAHALKSLIIEQYKEYKTQNPDSDSESTNKEAHDIALGYRTILKDLQTVFELKPETIEDSEAFNKNEIALFKASFKDIFSHIKSKTARSFFENKLEKDWSEYMDLYYKGYHLGVKVGVGQALQQQKDRKEGNKSNDQSFFIRTILEAGKIQDADILDVEWFESQDELNRQIFYAKEEVGLDDFDWLDAHKDEQGILEELQGISQQLDAAIVENSVLNFGEAVDPEKKQKEQELLALENAKKLELEAAKSRLADLEASMFLKVNKFRAKVAETITFESSEDDNALFLSFLKNKSRTLSVDGQFNDKNGNAQVWGKGKFELDDKKHKINYKAQVLLGLGDLSFAASGYERDDKELFVKLGAGKLTAPKEKVRKGTPHEFDFDSLTLEMGMGILEQTEQQLHLDDHLSAGAMLMNDIFGLGWS